jgi:hypothetical protein
MINHFIVVSHSKIWSSGATCCLVIFSHAWIIPIKQRKINPVMGRQMAQKLLLPTTISVLIQLSKA